MKFTVAEIVDKVKNIGISPESQYMDATIRETGHSGKISHMNSRGKPISEFKIDKKVMFTHNWEKAKPRDLSVSVRPVGDNNYRIQLGTDVGDRAYTFRELQSDRAGVKQAIVKISSDIPPNASDTRIRWK